MKNNKMKELFKTTFMRAGTLMLTAAVVIGAGMWTYEQQNNVPELVTFVDMDNAIQIEEDEVPLGAPQVSKSTKTKKKTKKIKLRKAAKKTYKEKGKSKTSKKTSKRKTNAKTTTTETIKQTSVTNQYKKGSKINTQVTMEKTTVITTVIAAKGKEQEEKLKVNLNTAQNTMPTVVKASAESAGSGDLESLASEADARVLDAFKKLGFEVTVNGSVPYSGLFDARTQSITLRRADSTIYHELGHFLSFVAGNMDKTPEFVAIYQREKDKYNAPNKAYVTSSSSEYFAESFRSYTEVPTIMKTERPETYAAIQTALSKITDAQISRLLSVYGSVWKNK